jgi:hypothetical protein
VDSCSYVNTVCVAALQGCCIEALHTVLFVHGEIHSDWFNGIEILQGRWQRGENVGYCYYPSGLEKTLCKWDIYVPLVRTCMSHWSGHVCLTGQDMYVSLVRTCMSHWSGHVCLTGRDMYVSLVRTCMSHWSGHVCLTGQDMYVSLVTKGLKWNNLLL